YLAMIRLPTTSTLFPYTTLFRSAIFNMRLAKGAVATKENRQRIIDMMKVLFRNYGQQIQFNVVDDKVYKDAMKNPEKYKDLMVRSEEHTSELQSRENLVCRLLLE